MKKIGLSACALAALVGWSNLQARWQEIKYTGDAKISQLGLTGSGQMWAIVSVAKNQKGRKKDWHIAQWNEAGKTWDKKLLLKKDAYHHGVSSFSVAPDGSVFFTTEGVEKELSGRGVLLKRFANGSLETIRDFGKDAINDATGSIDEVKGVAALGENNVVVARWHWTRVGVPGMGGYVEKWDGSSWKRLGQFLRYEDPDKKRFDPGKFTLITWIAAGADGALYTGGTLGLVGTDKKYNNENTLLVLDGSVWKRFGIPLPRDVSNDSFAVAKKDDLWFIFGDSKGKKEWVVHWNGTELEKKDMGPFKAEQRVRLKIAASSESVVLYNLFDGKLYKWIE